MMLIAHRGMWDKTIKDNSYEAILRALKSEKYIGTECDIRTTLDKKFIVYHNILYKGTLVSNTYYKDMENVLLLEDLLRVNTDKLILLEIKENNIDKKRLLRLLNKYKRNYYIMSFHSKVINELKNMDKTYKYGVLNYVLNSDSKYNLDFICLLDGVATESVIKNFEKRGIEVIIYGTIKVNKNVKYIVDDYKMIK